MIKRIFILLLTLGILVSASAVASIYAVPVTRTFKRGVARSPKSQPPRRHSSSTSRPEPDN